MQLSKQLWVGSASIFTREIYEESYGDPSMLEDAIDEKTVNLAQLISLEKEKFLYLYDFGDDWEHDILVEKILPIEKRTHYPVCVDGKRACPPED